MLAVGAVHLDPGGRGHVYANFGGIVEPYFVLDNLGVESGGAKLLRYVFGGGFVFGRASDVGRLGKNAEVLFGELGVGHGHEFFFEFPLGGNVAKSADRPVVGLVFVLVVLIFVFSALIDGLQVGGNQREEQNCTREKFHEAPFGQRRVHQAGRSGRNPYAK